jgi:hypothetical protein
MSANMFKKSRLRINAGLTKGRKENKLSYVYSIRKVSISINSLILFGGNSGWQPFF